MLLAYPLVWAALYSVAFDYWFLPAGLRLAMLWLVPTRHWGWLACAEWIATLVVMDFDGQYGSALIAAAGVTLPWVVYAVSVHQVQRRVAMAERDNGAYRVSSILIAGLTGAVINSALLSGLHVLDGQPTDSSVGTLLRFALGDFAGVIAVSPLLLLAADHIRDPMPFRHYAQRGAVLAPALGLAIGSWPDPAFPEQYRWFLISVPLLALGALSGRTSVVIAIGAVTVALLVVTRDGGPPWLLFEIQRILGVTGTAALLLGARTDAMHVQREQLSISIEELEHRTHALREAAIRLSSQREDESRRIGLELHDQVGQDMTALAIRIHLAGRSATSDAMRGELGMLQQMVSSAHDHLRSVIRHLHPIALERFGLARALTHGPLSEIASDAAISYRCEIVGPVSTLPVDVATPIYRICQEAVTNGIRHGCGGKITIKLELGTSDDGRDLQLSIHDQAGAICLPAESVSMGLQGIRDRAHSLGAEYRFNCESGQPRHWLSMTIPTERSASSSDAREGPMTSSDRLRAVRLAASSASDRAD